MRRHYPMSETTRLVTAEELERYPDDGHRYELVEGRLVRMSPVTFEHGRIVMRLGSLLGRYLEQHPVGVVGADVGFKLASNPDTVRGPDIAFLRHDRVPPRGARGFVPGPPDLVIEVVSPDDRPEEIRAKTEEYLARGVLLVLVVDPDDQTVTMARPGAAPYVLHLPDEVVDLDNVITGFSCRLREIFQ
jgi:Uma2 family endonuclease